CKCSDTSVQSDIHTSVQRIVALRCILSTFLYILLFSIKSTIGQLNYK
ncbi:hypothetical protein Gotur_010380, partial [Gossypium turneri]